MNFKNEIKELGEGLLAWFRILSGLFLMFTIIYGIVIFFRGGC